MSWPGRGGSQHLIGGVASDGAQDPPEEACVRSKVRALLQGCRWPFPTQVPWPDPLPHQPRTPLCAFTFSQPISFLLDCLDIDI